jgi:uncharacterized protein YbjT (DUF2867 family)
MTFVRLLTDRAPQWLPGKPGDITEVSPMVATRLVARGLAEVVDRPGTAQRATPVRRPYRRTGGRAARFATAPPTGAGTDL